MQLCAAEKGYAGMHAHINDVVSAWCRRMNSNKIYHLNRPGPSNEQCLEETCTKKVSLRFHSKP
jgi:hypothetical protein